MTFSTFLIVLIVAYAIYYGIIIFLDLSKKNISEEKEQNYSNIEIDEDEFKAVDASKIYAETIGKTPPVQAEDVAEEPKDESSIMNGAQSKQFLFRILLNPVGRMITRKCPIWKPQNRLVL